MSYSHRDRQYRDRLKVALAQLRRDGLITEWDDQMISAGDEWDESIQHALASADLVLLLVSPDFIASNYSYDNELANALARHERGDVRIIPIIVRPADWRSAPFAHLQALPTGTRAVTEWGNRDRAWADIAAGIRRVVSEAPMPSAIEDEDDELDTADGTHAHADTTTPPQSGPTVKDATGRAPSRRDTQIEIDEKIGEKDTPRQPARLDEAALLRHIKGARWLEAGEKAVDTCPYEFAFVPRELSGKRQQRFQHGYVVLTNRRILLIQYKKLMLNFPWSTFAWSAVQPPSGVSDASVELGSDAHTADIYLHVTGGERAEALERAVAAQIAKAKRQAGKPGERVSATQQKQVTSRQDTRQEPVRDEQVGKPMAGSAARATPSRQHTDSKSASRPRQTPARQRPMPIVGWPGFLAHHHEGDVLDGHVTRIYDDHAGVSLVAGVDGTLPGKRLGRQEFVPGSGPRLGIGSAVRVKIEKIKQPDPPSWPRSKLQPNKTPLGELPVGSLVQAKSTTEGVASAAVWKVTGHEDGKTQLEIVKEVEYEPARRFSGGGKPGYTQSFRNNSRFAFAATPYDEAYVVVSLVEEIPPNDPTRRLTK